MRSVQDEDGYNQGWTGGHSTQVRMQRRCDLIASKMDAAPDRTVLEIGCGRGEMAGMLAVRTGMQVLGTDISAGFVEEARVKAAADNVTFEVLDFTQPAQVMGRRFDYVVGNGILHHLYHDLPAALQSMQTLLPSGGRILFLEPNLHNPYVYLIFSQPKLRKVARLEPDEMAFSRKFAIERLRAAGFRDIEVEYRDFLLPGVPDWTIKPLINIGTVAERAPGVKHLSQSLFIAATAP